MQRKGKIREGVNFISKKRLPKKKRGKSGSERRIAIDGVEDGAKKAGKTRESVLSIYGFRLPQTKHF